MLKSGHSGLKEQSGGGGAKQTAQAVQNSIFSAPARKPKPLGELADSAVFKLVNDYLQAFGRPRTTSGVKHQGEHVTAIALVTKGFKRQFNYSETSYREKKKLILNYIERLSVLERYKFPDADPAADAVADHGSAADPDSSEDMEQSESEAVLQLLTCVSNILEAYNAQRIYKSYIKSKTEDLARKTYQQFAKATDLEDLDLALGDTPINDEQSIPKLLEFYAQRILQGNKTEIIKNLQTALNKLYASSASSDPTPPVTKDALIDAISNNDLDRKSRDFSEIKSLEQINATLIIRTCETLSTLATTYYNRLQGVAFNHADKKLPKPADKILEAAALKYLDERYGKIQPIFAAIKKAQEKLETLPDKTTMEACKLNEEVTALKKQCQDLDGDRTELIANIEGLFDYAEVSKEIKGKAGFRDNDRSKLILVMARHLHIVINVYPEILVVYGDEYFASEDFQEHIIEPFVARILQRTWPSIKKNKHDSIVVDITKQLLLFSKENKIISSRFDALASSSGSNTDSDEEQVPATLGKSL